MNIKKVGSVKFSAGTENLVVKDEDFTADSYVFPCVASNDLTMKSVSVVANNGFVAFYPDHVPTHDVLVNWFLVEA